jgi:hypothetical protein
MSIDIITEIRNNAKIIRLSIKSNLINSIKIQITQFIKRFIPNIAEKTYKKLVCK